jgi:hypothetical protein
VEVGKWADLVVWKPAFFGVKPALILKGGFIAMAAMGDPNASIPTPQPVHYRPMFGAFGGALAKRLTYLCLPGGHERRHQGALWPGQDLERREKHPGVCANSTWSTTATCPAWRSTRKPTACVPMVCC